MRANRGRGDAPAPRARPALAGRLGHVGACIFGKRRRRRHLQRSLNPVAPGLSPALTLLSRCGTSSAPSPVFNPMFTLGIDYGTNSVRALVVRCADGEEFGTCVVNYPSGAQGILARSARSPSRAPASRRLSFRPGESGEAARSRRRRRQRGFEPRKSSVSAWTPPAPARFRSTRETSRSPRPASGKKNLHAQCWLWKDHTSWREAAKITELAAQHRPHYIAKCGNTYSSEWWWSKIWHCLEVAPDVFNAAYSWVELCRLGSGGARRRHRSETGEARCLRRGPQSALCRRVGRLA